MEEYFYVSYDTGEMFTKEEMISDFRRNYPNLDYTDSRIVLRHYEQIEKEAE